MSVQAFDTSHDGGFGDYDIRHSRLAVHGREPRPGSGLNASYDVIDLRTHETVATATSFQAAHAAVRLLNGWCE